MDEFAHKNTVKAHRLLVPSDIEDILHHCLADPTFRLCKILSNATGLFVEFEFEITHKKASALDKVAINKGDWFVYSNGTYTAYTDNDFRKHFIPIDQSIPIEEALP